MEKNYLIILIDAYIASNQWDKIRKLRDDLEEQQQKNGAIHPNDLDVFNYADFNLVLHEKVEFQEIFKDESDFAIQYRLN
jgi:hypothetical protein